MPPIAWVVIRKIWKYHRPDLLHEVPKGKISGAMGLFPCFVCSMAGKYANNIQNECYLCNAGFYSNYNVHGNSKCLECEPGKYGQGTNCYRCTSGHTQITMLQLDAKKPASSYQEEWGQSSCNACRNGTIIVYNNGRPGCESCRKGQPAML